MNVNTMTPTAIRERIVVVEDHMESTWLNQSPEEYELYRIELVALNKVLDNIPSTAVDPQDLV